MDSSDEKDLQNSDTEYDKSQDKKSVIVPEELGFPQAGTSVPAISTGAIPKSTSTPHTVRGKKMKSKSKMISRLPGGADTEARLISGEFTPSEIKSYYLTLTDSPITDSNILISKVYREMIAEEKDLSSIQEWDKRLKHEINAIESQKIRDLNIPRPFIDQIHHFLKLCGLEAREWSEIYRAVVFDDSDEAKTTYDRISYACRYIGFDPSMILRRLIRFHKEGKRQELHTYVIVYEHQGEALDWVYTNKESFMKDMTFLLITFLQRGAVVSKIAKKSTKDYTAVLRMLIAKYGIKADEVEGRRRRAEALSPEIITLPRIAACLSQVTTSLYHVGYGRAIANFNEFGELPAAIFSPMFASVVRKSYKQDHVLYNMHPQLILIAILIDNVLHIRNKVTPLDQIWTYYLAAYQSSVLIDGARILQCNEFGVTINGLFIEPILLLREHCKRRIRELRPHERIDDIFREMDDMI